VKIHTEVRLRSRVAEAAIEATVKGRVLSGADFDVLLTGPTRVLKPDGRPLCVYLPGAVRDHSTNPETYEILSNVRLQASTSKNRGPASGTLRLSGGNVRRSYTKEIESSIVGAVDPLGQMRYCRLTSWTGQHLPQWQALQPLLQCIATNLADHVPDRYAAQLAEARRSDPAWVVPGTPFSTVTVNNTYPTGVHKDKGDLEAGFSTIAVLRRGTYTGGQLVFPAWRVGVDLSDGDLILMDAHDWHGNVNLFCACGTPPNGPCPDCAAERISVVCYFRTKIVKCGTPAQEFDRASARGEVRGLARLTREAVPDAGH
jgi:hypothetical protein